MANQNWRFTLSLIALPLFFLMMSGLARAETFTVTNTTDPSSPMAGDGSLREAIINANSAGGTNTIQFNTGVTGTITLGSTLPAIVGGSTLTITGPTASPGIAISGGHAVQLMVVNAGATLTLQFLTMEDGNMTGATNSNGLGGAINNSGTLTIANSTFSGNQAIGGDGFGNLETGGSIGALGEGGAIYNSGMLTIANSTFSANQAIGGAGTVGGASFGGAIANLGTLTFTNSTVSGNQAIGGAGSFYVGTFGGAIYNGEGILTFTNSTFSGNHTADCGGAIFNFGNLTFTKSTFSGNYADDGGAIYDLGFPTTITNSTFSGNQATTDRGGAIYEFYELIATNSTFSGNQAAAGGGAIDFQIDTLGSVTLKGVILADSTGGNCAVTSDEGLTNTITDEGYNIADDDSCGFVEAPSGTSINNSTTLNLDPAGLANNGGPTQTIALEPNSQAVDFIPVASCTDQSMPPVPLTTDQRGFPRPDPGNPDFCDAGAYELQTTPVVISSQGERLQIARSTAPDSDQINMAFTFTEIGFPACDAADDAFNGFTVLLRTGSCGALVDDASLELMLAPWAVHTVNHQSYGTFFESMPPETISARMVELPTPAAPACGEWTVNIEATGVDTSSLGDGPFALILSNADGDTGCFDVTNAIVGNQIDPPSRTVRRGARR